MSYITKQHCEKNIMIKNHPQFSSSNCDTKKETKQEINRVDQIGFL
jgi:hypothetical protein